MEVEVCIICGAVGFTNALLHCSECSDASVHQYCLGIPPGSIDDNFEWVCECCSLPMEPESYTRQGTSKSCGEHPKDVKMESEDEVDALLDQPEPLCTLFPVQYGNSTRENTSNQTRKQDASVSLYMEHPDTITRGLILVVSPSGEVFINEGMTLDDYSHFSSLASHVVDMISNSNYIKSDDAFEKLPTYNYKVKHKYSPLHNPVVKHAESDFEGTKELRKPKFRTLSEIYARLSEPTNCSKIRGRTNSSVDVCKEKLKDSALLKTSSIDGLKKKGNGGRNRKSYDTSKAKVFACKLNNKADVLSSQPNGGSVVNLRRRVKRKRTVEPEVDVIRRKKVSVYKGSEVDAECPSSKPKRTLKNCNRQKRRSNKCNMKK